jgi:hypothetical protein
MTKSAPNPNEPIAYRIGKEILCLDPLCLMHYVNEMSVAQPLLQSDIEREQYDRDGRPVSCDSCTEPLDLWNKTGAWL